MKTLETFATWSDVLAHVKAGNPTYYQALMEFRPFRVIASTRGVRPARVRVTPFFDADAFWADCHDLGRFRKESA